MHGRGRSSSLSKNQIKNNKVGCNHLWINLFLHKSIHLSFKLLSFGIGDHYHDDIQKWSYVQVVAGHSTWAIKHVPYMLLKLLYYIYVIDNIKNWLVHCEGLRKKKSIFLNVDIATLTLIITAVARISSL